MTLSISDTGGGWLWIGGPLIIENMGVVTQTGGDVGSNHSISINKGGIYNLVAGSLGVYPSVGGVSVYGTLNQTGGKLDPSESFFIGDGGVYNISKTAQLNARDFHGGSRVASGGIVNQNGGTAAFTDLYLDVQGTYNLSDGQLYSSTSWMSGISKGGTFNQSGGTYTNERGLRIGASIEDSSTYNLSGGTLNADTILVNGRLNYSGGELHLTTGSVIEGYPEIKSGTLTNNGTTTLSGNGTRTIDGNIENNGIFKTTNTSAVYTGTFTNNGAYISDPSSQRFNDLVIGQTGYIKGGLLDFFCIGGDFKNQSIMNTAWNTSLAYLGFVDGADALHDFYIAGVDYGASLSGYSDNFSWGFLDLRSDFLNLSDGNDMAGGGLYVGDIFGLQITDYLITNITGMDGLNIYYLANLLDNSYLRGLTYDLTGGGHLIPIGLASVPEPATVLFFGCGLIGLAGLRRKLKQ